MVSLQFFYKKIFIFKCDTVVERNFKQALQLSCILTKQIMQNKSTNSFIKLKAKQLVLEPKNIISQIFITWISPFISYAMKTIAQQDSVPQLPERFKSINQSQHLIQNFENQLKSGRQNKEGVKLLKAIIKSARPHAVPLCVFYLINAISELSLPVLTQRVISYIQNQNKKLSLSIMYVSLVLLSRFLYNISLANLYYRTGVIGFNLSTTLSICIFNKALKYPTLCNKSITIGQLINYTQVDADRFSDIGWDLGSALFSPLVLLFGIIMMLNYIGAPFLAGVGVMTTIFVLVFMITKRQNKANDDLLESKDQRMGITTEIFNNIRFIKSNAWEKYYFNKLNRSRNEELRKLQKVNVLQILKIFLVWLAIPLSISSTFGVYVYIGNELTAQVAFTTIVMYGILQYPISDLPQTVGKMSQTWSSIKRIQRFLRTQQIQNYYIKSQTDNYEDQVAIKFKSGTFYWETEQLNNDSGNQQNQISQTDNTQSKVQPESLTQIKQSLLSDFDVQHHEESIGPHIKALKNINLEIKRNKLTIILGSVGSGKSSLLYSVLGEMKPYPGSNAEIHVNGSVAFVPQKSWVMSQNIQQNILMTQQKDNDLLKSALRYSCLDNDIKQFPDGVKTIIGEKGINLSGGQKARVCLARALYSNKDIYLLDDIISAVDVHVADRIVKDCILTYLKQKTVILVTHSIAFAKYADEILIMKKGEIVDRGTYSDLKDKQFFKQIEKEENQNCQNQKQTDKKANTIRSSFSNPIQRRRFSSQQLVQSSVTKVVDELLLPQDRMRGEIKLKTYLTYFKLNGGIPYILGILITMSLYTSLNVFGNIQIQKWCQSSEPGFTNLYIYMGCTIMAGIFSSLRATIVYTAGIKQSSIVHKKMIKSLIYASVPQFFDRVPTGRILNRVSKDMREIDENISPTFQTVLISSFNLLGQICICIYASTPYVIIPIVAFFIACLVLKKYFMKCQREIVRIEAISNSPILSFFTQSVNGLPNVRAFKLNKNFHDKQCQLIDVNKRNKMCKQAVQSWFCQRLGFMSLIINVTATAYCIFSSQNNPALIGLLLAYCSQLDDSIVWLTNGLAELESRIISVERTSTFMEIEPEVGYIQYTKKWRTKDEPIIKLISDGKVEFRNFSLKYRQNLPFVLKDINLEIRPGEKIGVVGRTGAGKSTIIQSLLRMIEPSQGSIVIDGQSITTIPLKDLRSSLTLIAQQPVLIAGTLRQNLDPRNQHNDQQLISALQKCCLIEMFKQRDLLDTIISESGQNLSIGEKQLICITRAILRSNKLVLIDEATANIDMKADQLIQQTIRSCFKDSTVITIAHRIKTILDSDRILVLQKGRIAEFDTPEKLKERKGIFNEMYEKSQADIHKQ